MKIHFASLILLPAALLVALTACATGGAGAGGAGSSASGSTGSSAGASSHGDDNRCVTGTWDLDVPGAAAQMLSYLSAKGVPISSATGSGPITLDITGHGAMTYSTGATYTFNAQAGNLPMVITQVQAGTSHGSWAWASGSALTMDFSGWTNAITFTTTVTVGGQASAIPMSIPNQGPGSTPLAATCNDSTLTLKADASPFTLTFRRE
ncbi:MAG: hypothetical protein ABJA11_08705 [Pseudolysinimonas sp.]